MAGDGEGRPLRWAVAGVALFLVAVLLARLLIAGGVAWLGLVVAVPLLLFAVSAAVGFGAAVVVTSLFVLVVLGFRWLLVASPGAWVALLLLPVVAIVAIVAGRVVAELTRQRRATSVPRTQKSGEEEGEEE